MALTLCFKLEAIYINFYFFLTVIMDETLEVLLSAI